MPGTPAPTPSQYKIDVVTAFNALRLEAKIIRELPTRTNEWDEETFFDRISNSPADQSSSSSATKKGLSEAETKLWHEVIECFKKWGYIKTNKKESPEKPMIDDITNANDNSNNDSVRVLLAANSEEDSTPDNANNAATDLTSQPLKRNNTDEIHRMTTAESNQNRQQTGDIKDFLPEKSLADSLREKLVTELDAYHRSYQLLYNRTTFHKNSYSEKLLKATADPLIRAVLLQHHLNTDEHKHGSRSTQAWVLAQLYILNNHSALEQKVMEFLKVSKEVANCLIAQLYVEQTTTQTSNTAPATNREAMSSTTPPLQPGITQQPILLEVQKKYASTATSV